jgi:hypothetical protein
MAKGTNGYVAAAAKALRKKEKSVSSLSKLLEKKTSLGPSYFVL